MKNVTDYPTVQDAIDSFSPTEPVALYFPAGIYALNQGLSVTARTVTLRGDGQDATELRFANGVTHGIQINNSAAGSNQYPIYIGDMAITTNNEASGTAVIISYQSDFEHRWKGRGLLYNMEIRGVTSTKGWKYGVAYHEGVNLSISHVSFLGKHDQSDQSEAANTQSHVAITWAGRKTPCELKISDSVFTAWEVGVNLIEKTEGVYIQQSTFLFCETGVRWYIDDEADRSRPLLVLSDSHLNVYKNAVYLGYVIESMIHDNLIYLNDHSNGGNAIVLNGCGTTTIHHNVFHSFQKSCNGIVLTGGSQYCDISSNIFTGNKKDKPPDWNWDTGIWLQAGTAFNAMTDNSFYEQCRFCEIYNQGIDNVVRNVRPGIRVFK